MAIGGVHYVVNTCRGMDELPNDSIPLLSIPTLYNSRFASESLAIDSHECEPESKVM